MSWYSPPSSVQAFTVLLNERIYWCMVISDYALHPRPLSALGPSQQDQPAKLPYFTIDNSAVNTFTIHRDALRVYVYYPLSKTCNTRGAQSTWLPR